MLCLDMIWSIQTPNVAALLAPDGEESTRRACLLSADNGPDLALLVIT